jgi:tetratricopeptide (TPR) repeat protein
MIRSGFGRTRPRALWGAGALGIALMVMAAPCDLAPAAEPAPQRESLRTRLLEAEALASSGDPAAAEHALRDLAREHPGSWMVHLVLGRLLYGGRQVQEALPHLEKAAALAPQQFEARSTLGQAYAVLEKLPEAERELRAAVGLRPNDAGSRFNLGRLYRLQARYAEALPELESALANTRDGKRLPNVHQNLALVLQALHRPTQAAPHLEAFLAARPDQDDMRMQLATLRFDLSEYDAALAAVERVLARQPRRPDALYLRGMLLKIKVRNDDAIASFRAALDADPAFHRARYQLATVLIDEGRHAQAEELLRAVLAAEPEHLTAHYLLSGVLRRLGREREADEELAAHNRIAEAQRSRGRTTSAGAE